MTHHLALFTDGGLVGRNPSRHGGTWAYCITEGDFRIDDASGLILPADFGIPTVSSNLAELVAAVSGLEAMPDGWAGDWFTDSSVTLARLTDRGMPGNTIPKAIIERAVAAVARLGKFRARLLGGHPTKVELRRGRRADGAMVSRHNCFCDAACTEQANAFKMRRVVRLVELVAMQTTR